MAEEWEYRITEKGKDDGTPDGTTFRDATDLSENWGESLNELGQKGWELAGTDGNRFYFKKRKGQGTGMADPRTIGTGGPTRGRR